MRINPTKIQVPIPLVSQCDDRSCGPACLASVMAYYHVPFQNLERVRRVLKTTDLGTSPELLLRGAEASGLEFHENHDVDVDTLKFYANLSYPTICLIQAHGDGHYVVVVGVDQRFVYFMDPMIEGHYGYRSHRNFQGLWFDGEFHGYMVAAFRRTRPDRLIVREVL